MHSIQNSSKNKNKNLTYSFIFIFISIPGTHPRSLRDGNGSHGSNIHFYSQIISQKAMNSRTFKATRKHWVESDEVVEFTLDSVGFWFVLCSGILVSDDCSFETTATPFW